MSKALTKSNDPGRAFLTQALSAHQEFGTFFAKAKERALLTGWYLDQWLAANDGADQGELLATIEEQLPRRTAEKYLAFARTLLEWVAIEAPKLKGEKALERAKQIVMQSPKPLTGLLREVGQLINPQFEHNPAGYQEKRLAAKSGQLEFEFGTKAVAVLKALPVIKPETWGRFERADLEAAKTKAEQLLAGINAALNTVDVGGQAE